MDQIIFHAYPQSPVSEKVRVGFGIKNLSWRSVEVPRIPPKPLLMPLTGGYRRAPVMQIGADVYCDSQCILRELERRFPEPTFYPGGADGMVWGVSRWTDGVLFDNSVKLVLGAAADELPEAFAKDRGRLYLGPDADLHAVKADLAHVISQVRPQLGWMDQRLSGGRKFMLGDYPGLPDAVAYYHVWFIRGRWAKGPEFLSQFPALEAWEKRVAALGHGSSSDMSGEEALEIAKAAETVTPEAVDPLDPLELQVGDRVSIVADVDGGETGVEGPVRLVERDRIVIEHEAPEVGRIAIHFPRVGYRVTGV